MKSRWKIVAAAAMLLAVPVAAQDYMPSFSNSTLLIDYANSINIKNINDRASERRGTPSTRRSTARPAVPPAASPSRAAAASTRYRPSAAVSQKVKQRFVAFIGQHAGAAGAREMQALLAGQDATALWLPLVQQDGLVRHDLADAMAAYWVLNWGIANNDVSANRAQILGVREQIRGVIATSPALVALDNDGKQELAEALILNFLVQHAAYGNAMKAGDTAMRRKLGDAATARFRNEAGLNLRALKLTARGLVPG